MSGLILYTATVTHDLYMARDTLTRQLEGGILNGALYLDFSYIAYDYKASLAVFRDQSAFITVTRRNDRYGVSMVSGAIQDDQNDWKIITLNRTEATKPITGSSIYLRVSLDVRHSGTQTASFSYSTDGTNFESPSSSFKLTNSWYYFNGYWYGIFNFDTKAIGGHVRVISFTMDKGTPTDEHWTAISTTTTSSARAITTTHKHTAPSIPGNPVTSNTVNPLLASTLISVHKSTPMCVAGHWE